MYALRYILVLRRSHYYYYLLLYCAAARGFLGKIQIPTTIFFLLPFLTVIIAQANLRTTIFSEASKRTL